MIFLIIIVHQTKNQEIILIILLPLSKIIWNKITILVINQINNKIQIILEILIQIIRYIIKFVLIIIIIMFIMSLINNKNKLFYNIVNI